MKVTKFLCMAALATTVPAAWGASITMHSGNGSIGSTDSAVTFLDGPPDSAFASTFTTANFTSARTGTAASIIGPNGSWIAASNIPGALWIGTSSSAAGSGDTALYAISFNIPTAFTSASISLSYAVDNVLGTGPNSALYLNGTALPTQPGSGGFGSVSTYTSSAIGPLLQVGTNTFYINATDQGGPAGLLFSATINTVDSTSGVPEPSTFLGMGSGLIALWGARYFRKV